MSALHALCSWPKFRDFRGGGALVFCMNGHSGKLCGLLWVAPHITRPRHNRAEKKSCMWFGDVCTLTGVILKPLAVLPATAWVLLDDVM